VLRAGSVFGEAFWYSGLVRLLGRPPTASLLEELERQEWILRRHESRFHEETEFMFGHNLFREAAYAMLTAPDRSLGHLLAGEWLAEVKEHDSLTLAEHFERGGDLARALTCYEKAAAEALESNDLSAVINRVEKGLACGAQGEIAGKLHTWAATARNWEGNFHEGARHARLAVRLVPRASELWYVAIERLVWASGSLEDIDQVENIAQLLQKSISQHIEHSAISTLCNTTGWLYTYDRKVAASSLARLVDRIDAKQGEPLVSAQIHEWKSWIATFTMQIEAVLQNVEASVSFYELAGDSRKACFQRSNLGGTLFDLGLYDRADAVLRQAMEEAERLGLRYPAVVSRMWLGMILAAKGHIDDGRVFLREALDESLTCGDTYNERVGRILFARVLLMAGSREEAEREALAVIEAPPPSWSAFIQALMAQILLSAGRFPEALVYAKRGEENLRTHGFAAIGAGLVHLTVVEALRAVGAHGSASAALREAQDWLSTQAQQIQSPELRRSFVENVPEHARIMALSCSLEAE
jgi:tetratricopeptide (TPR) repeat protein